MPAGDGTGPAGMGPMTGRAAGYCAGYSVPGYTNPGGRRGAYGYGRGWYGRGAGRGWRNRYYATGDPGWGRAQYAPGAWTAGAYPYDEQPDAEEEMQLLKEQAEELKRQLKVVEKRIDSLGERPDENEE